MKTDKFLFDPTTHYQMDVQRRVDADWLQSFDSSAEISVTETRQMEDITVRLPSDVGVRTEIKAGPTAINASGLTKDGNMYTNDAYGTSEVTLQIAIEAGVGLVNLEVEE